jgi:hypothetical protein
MEKRKLSKTEIHNIANLARNTLNIDTEILILKRKTFKTTIGTSQRGGTYNYFQDKVLINKSELDLRTLPHSKWTIFHEYGHAYFARIFAKNGLFPMIVYAANIENALIESGVKHMWNGLCDCFVNDLILRKFEAKKFDPTMEATIDQISPKLATGMCFHLYDYWKHGFSDKVATKAREKLPPEIRDYLERKLDVYPLSNPTNQLILDLLSNIASQSFPIKINIVSILKEEIERETKSTLPSFWGKKGKILELFQIT